MELGKAFKAEDMARQFIKGVTCSENSGKFSAVGIKCFPRQANNMAFVGLRWLVYGSGNRAGSKIGT